MTFRIASVKLILQDEIQLQLTNGGPAGDPLLPGNYVAKLKHPSSDGIYSIFAADSNFNIIPDQGHLANIHIDLKSDGTAIIT